MAFCKKWSTMSGLVTCKKNYFKVYLMEIRNFMCWILNFCVNSEEAIGNSEALRMQPNFSGAVPPFFSRERTRYGTTYFSWQWTQDP
jgi:hypothetical protein